MPKISQKTELDFWESLKKRGPKQDIAYARNLPDRTPLFLLEMFLKLETKIAEFCWHEASGIILDAGCGNGELLFRSPTPQSRQIQYVGIDFADNMLRRAAARRNTVEPNGDISFVRGSIVSLPFRSQAFSRVISSGSVTCLTTMTEAEGALKEYHRVLQAEGLLFVDFTDRMSILGLIGEICSKVDYLPPRLFSKAEFRTILESVGFIIIGLREFDYRPRQNAILLRIWRRASKKFEDTKIGDFIENWMIPKMSSVKVFGSRVYVKCERHVER